MRQSIKLSLLAISAVTANVAQAVASSDAPKPNIVLILLDDAGYSDFGCYGSEIETPNIDRLAEQGVRLRHFYNQARSGPTRASLMTGQYAHQVGNGALGQVKGYPEHYQGYPNNNNVFMPELLKDAGYFSFVTGKWHLGFPKGLTPASRGFDRSLNAPFGAYYFSDDVRKKGKKFIYEDNLYLNGESVRFDDDRLPKEWYSTDLWTTFGLKFVDEALEQERPFFWYLAYNAPHFPIQAPAETIAKYRGKYRQGWDSVREARYAKQIELGLFDKSNPLSPRNPLAGEWEDLTETEKDKRDLQMAVYAAAIDEIDQNIGRVVEHLRERNQLDNTIIILLSDNGGNGEPAVDGVMKGDNPGDSKSTVFIGAAWADVANTPFYLYKHHGHEGGCNTPFIISYPDGIDESVRGTIDRDSYGHLIDVMPTLAELSGAKYPSKRDRYDVPAMDGNSLTPLFRGETVGRDRGVILEHEGNKMLRQGDWKVVQEYKEPRWMLYNMKDDPTESNDLSKRKPKVLKEMVNEYQRMANYIGVEPSLEFHIGKWYTPVDEY